VGFVASIAVPIALLALLVSVIGALHAAAVDVARAEGFHAQASDVSDEVATPDEARAMLHLKGRDNVGF